MKAAALVVLGVILLVLDRGHALTAFTAAYFAGLGVALGALIWLQIAHVTRARWLLPVRRPLENAAGLLPLTALLFLPVLVRTRELYSWGGFTGSLASPVVDGIRPAWVHAAIAFAIWTAIAELLRAWSRRADTANAEEATRLQDRQRALAAGALPIVGLSLTMFSFDFLMTLEPGYRSSIYGLLFFTGAAVSGLAIATIGGVASRASLPPEVGQPHFFALGKMLLAMVMFWTYIQLSQLILVWMANLPSEAGWYLTRSRGPWLVLGIAVGVVCFALPFLVLLSRRFKRKPERVAGLAVFLLFAHWLDVLWLVLPSLRPAGGPAIADLGAALVMIGILLLFGALRGRGAAAYPLRDPDLAGALRFEDA